MVSRTVALRFSSFQLLREGADEDRPFNEVSSCFETSEEEDAHEDTVSDSHSTRYQSLVPPQEGPRPVRP